MKVFCVILCMCAVSSATFTCDEIEQKYSDYKLQYGWCLRYESICVFSKPNVSEKYYKDPLENAKRLVVFWENLIEIETHNERYKQGKESFFMGLNARTDCVSIR